jgi:hypothetical protein
MAWTAEDHTQVVTFALSTSQSLTLAVILLWVGGLAMIVFAYIAFDPQKQTRQKIDDAIDRITSVVQKAAEEGSGAGAPGGGPQEPQPAPQSPQPALAGAADYVRALGELAEKLGKVSPPVAALLIATVPFMFAATLVAIQLLE